MACLASPSATSTLKHNPTLSHTSPYKPTCLNSFCFLTSTNQRLRTASTVKCNGFLGDHLGETLLHLDQIPAFRSGLMQFERATEELSEAQKWGFLAFAGLTWLYLTARPGVLVGAIDSYLLAPLQLGFNSLTGRRSLKRSDFVIGDKLGEGSFGVVYSGAIVPKNVDVDDETAQRRSGRGKGAKLDERFKEKVILKMVSVKM